MRVCLLFYMRKELERESMCEREENKAQFKEDFVCKFFFLMKFQYFHFSVSILLN